MSDIDARVKKIVAEQLGVITASKISRSSAYSYESLDGQIYQVLASKIDSDDEFWERVIKETDLKERMEDSIKFVETQYDVNDIVLRTITVYDVKYYDTYINV